MRTNAERAKEWRERNPERVKEYGRAYYAANREKSIAQAKEWYAKHPEREKYRIGFLGRVPRIGFNPRQGMCSECSKKGYTEMHHDKYDEQNVLAYTRELCRSCHRKWHWREKHG